MYSGLKQRLMKGVLAKGLGHGSLNAIRLAEVPLFLYFWGAELYGEWLILAALPMYIAMSDFGFSGAAGREITMLVGSGNRIEALSVFQSISILIIGLLGALIIIPLSILAVLPVEKLFNLTQIEPITFVMVAALLSITSSLSVYMKLLLGVYSSEGYYSRGFLFITFTLSGQFACVALAVASGAGPLTVAIVTLSTQVIGLFIMNLSAYRIAPWLQFGISNINYDKIRSLAKPSFAGMAMPFGQVATHSGIRLIIGLILGPVFVVSFVAHRQLARLVTFVATFAQPFEVELSRTYSSGEMGDFILLSQKTLQVLLWALLPVVLLSWLVASNVFHIWLGGRISFNSTLFNILLVASFLEALWYIVFSPTLAINEHVSPAIKYVLISSVLIPLGYFACKLSGLGAVAGVLVLTEGIMLAVVVQKLLSLSRQKFWHWLKQVTRFPSYAIRRLINIDAKDA